MSPDGDLRERRIAAERELLAALCQGSLDEKRRKELLRRLDTHTFAMPDHEVVFRALRKLPTIKPERVREALAAAVTRMGFPDADLNIYFEGHAPVEENLANLLREL
jgi:hypothetical protein